MVDTVGIDDRTWMDHVGHPHSNQLHVQERYTRADHDTITNVVNIDDPKTYTKPYIATTVTFQWNPKQEFEEQSLHSIQCTGLYGCHRAAGRGSNPNRNRPAKIV